MANDIGITNGDSKPVFTVAGKGGKPTVSVSCLSVNQPKDYQDKHGNAERDWDLNAKLTQRMTASLSGENITLDIDTEIFSSDVTPITATEDTGYGACTLVIMPLRRS